MLKGRTCVALLVTLMLTAGSVFAGMGTPVKMWTEAGPGTGNAYYGGGVIGDNFYTGQVGYGPQEWASVQTGGTPTALVNSYNGGTGSKCSTLINGKIYYSYDLAGGVYRMDDWNGTNITAKNDPGSAPEALATDGTYLFTNDDGSRGTIHKYAVSGSGNTLTLTEQFAAVTAATRIRGVSYYGGNIYVVDYSGTGIYEINATTGAVTTLGNHIGSSAYQVVRYNNELLVVGTDDKLTVYDFTGGTLGTGVAYDLGLGDLYGIGVVGDGTDVTGFWVTSTGGNVSYFVPEPATMMLLGLGGLALLRRRRK